MDLDSIFEGLTKFANVGTDVLKWLNNNIFSKSGTVVDVLKKVIDFFKNLFGGGGGGIGDFFKNLFG